MKHRAIGSTMVALVLVTMASAGTARAADKGKDDKKQSYIVVLKSTTADPGAIADEQAADGESDVKHVYRHALQGYAAEMSAKKAAKVAADPRVEWVELDKPVQMTAQSLPTGINRIDADTSSQLAGNG